MCVHAHVCVCVCGGNGNKQCSPAFRKPAVWCSQHSRPAYTFAAHGGRTMRLRVHNQTHTHPHTRTPVETERNGTRGTGAEKETTRNNILYTARHTFRPCRVWHFIWQQPQHPHLPGPSPYQWCCNRCGCLIKFRHRTHTHTHTTATRAHTYTSSLFFAAENRARGPFASALCVPVPVQFPLLSEGVGAVGGSRMRVSEAVIN